MDRRRRDHGFTLIELMVVVLVIAILLAIAIPTFLGSRNKSQDAVAQSHVREAISAAATLADGNGATVAELSASEPSLTWTTGPSTSPRVVSVGQSGTGNVFAVRSSSGRCFQGVYAPTGSSGPVVGPCGAAGVAAVAALGPGAVSTVAGNGTYGYSGDGGPALSASTREVYSLISRPTGEVIFSDRASHRVRQINLDGTVSTIAGLGTPTSGGDGALASATSLHGPGGLVLAPNGDMYIAETFGNKIRRVDSAGIITTIAGDGTGSSTGNGGPGSAATVWSPHDIAIDASGRVYWGEYYSNSVRRLELDGTVTLVAGSGVLASSGDGGPATAAGVRRPYGLLFDPADNLYIATEDSFIRRVTPGGVISTIAGNGTIGYSADGINPAGNPINRPLSMVWKGTTMYLAEYDGHVIRTWSGGVLGTVAGTGVSGFAGDGGPALTAQFDGPFNICLTVDGALLVADRFNSRIRRINL
jgi:prepilin-type N-terminal cleavage/methylation domain-containing protein